MDYRANLPMNYQFSGLDVVANKHLLDENSH